MINWNYRIAWQALLASALVAAALTALPVSANADTVLVAEPETLVETETVPAADEPDVTPSVEDREHGGDDSELVAELPVTSTAGFALVGVTWKLQDTPADLHVEVRTRREGAWSSWKALPIEDAPEEGGRGGTEPLWVSAADGVAARVFSPTGERPSDIEIAMIDPGEVDSIPSASPAAFATASIGRPAFVMRSQWKPTASEPCSVKERASLQGITVHHTAGSNSYSAAEAPNVIRGIHTFHVKSRGWCDIGYNALIDRFGTVYEGRRGGIDKMISGAHAGVTAVNNAFWGISLVGHFDSTAVPSAMKKALVSTAAWKLGAYAKPAKGTVTVGGKAYQRIIGHRDAKSTACPGAKAYEWLKQSGGLRDQVADTLAGERTATTPHAITKKYESLSGASGKLGKATSEIVTKSSGLSYQRFANGSIYSQSGATFALWAPVDTVYRSAGGTTGTLGMPTTDVSTNSRGLVYARFAKGSIYSVDGKSTAKTYAVWGPVDTVYRSGGGSAGELGLPTSGVATNSRGLVYARFANGSIYSVDGKSTAKTYAVWGPVDAEYRRLGGSNSAFGLPASSTQLKGKLQRADFAGGWIAWDPATKKISTSASSAPQPAPAPVTDSFTVPGSGKIPVNGRGFGHGIGMSQYGAEGAARQGLSYSQILKHYYPGTTLATKSKKIRVRLSEDTTADVKVVATSDLTFRVIGEDSIKLPASVGGKKVSHWRLVPRSKDKKVSELQYKAGTWKIYNGTVAKTNGQFRRTDGKPIGVVMTGGKVVKYRGSVREARPTATTRSTLSYVTLDEYVMGVVAAEMPTSWKPAAVQAQAVAARTYGIRSMNSSRYYDICDTTSCQVYRGYSGEDEAGNKAVKATSDRVLMYNGDYALTQYSSSNGGRSAAGSAPYLTAKADSYDGWSGNKRHTWTTTLTKATIEKKYKQLGTLKKITVLDRAGGGTWGGRAGKVRLHGSKSDVTISGPDFRFAFGLYSHWFHFG